jgi:DNA-directed RNA polymerase specialized sigma24 family protein
MSPVVLAALRRLPGRQREALVLRYYADLPEAAAADAMGVTRAAFRGHAARGMIALSLLLDQKPRG